MKNWVLFIFRSSFFIPFIVSFIKGFTAFFKEPFYLFLPVFLLEFTIWALIWNFIKRLWSDPYGDKHLRGRVLESTKSVARYLRKMEHHALLGTVPVPQQIESKHFMFAGATGSGKSSAFGQMLQSARERNQRAIIVDSGGEFLRRFFTEGDKILNPFDERSELWSPFAEMRGLWDADRISKSLIPDGRANDKEWNNYAQNLISAVLRRLWERGDGNNKVLFHYLLCSTIDDLSALVEGLPAATLFESGAEKMLGSVRGIIGSHLKSISYLEDGNFSLRRWVEKDDSSWLFITFRDEQLSTLRPLIASWLDMAIIGSLSLEPSQQRRIWFAFDELASLGRIQSLEALLTKARKQGCCAIAGLQSISQLRDAYGREGAQTLLSCLSSSLIFRSPDVETAEYFSKLLGEQEVLRTNHSKSEVKKSFGRVSSWSEQIVQRRLVLPSTLQTLPDRHGYLCLAGNYPICPVTVPALASSNQAKAFIDRSSHPKEQVERRGRRLVSA